MLDLCWTPPEPNKILPEPHKNPSRTQQNPTRTQHSYLPNSGEMSRILQNRFVSLGLILVDEIIGMVPIFSPGMSGFMQFE
jgi:hypothetical protein